jgi:hypothetical protein
MQETSLYEPVKRFLESMDFAVKGEIGGCDVVGVRPGEPDVVVICELKLQFNLELVLQAVDRAAACDEVWLAALMSARGKGREHDRRFRALSRRLGFGLLGVSGKGEVELILSPAALPPRRDPRRRSRLVEEHHRRKGDPSIGGSTRKKPIMTAYRQEALRCAGFLGRNGPLAIARLREAADAPNAARILQHNYYGWFERVARGVYALTPLGVRALDHFTTPAPAAKVKTAA